jgi:signal transduction histidine kinase
LIETKNHHLEIKPLPEDINLYVDRIRTTMAITNVLNNALTFTEPGGHITVESEVRGGHEIWSSVSDNGVGLESDDMERIFEPFYQVEDHMTRRHGGIGIGLSIARALVEANGGRIWASSPGLEQGATFTMALPLAKADKTS